MAGSKIYTLKEAPEGLCQVWLREGKAPELYDEGTALVPGASGGFELYVNPAESRFMLRAGRALGAGGVHRFSLNAGALRFGTREALDFLSGCYDCRHSLEAALPLGKDVLTHVSTVFGTVCRARVLADSASASAAPLTMVRALHALCKDAADARGGSVSCTLLKPGDRDFEEFAGLKAVGSGSSEPPCMGIIDYYPECSPEDAAIEVALAGKGITFDSGGYNLKPGKSMGDMRTDKSGAVNLACALALAIMLGLEHRIRLYLPCASNLVSPAAMVPGDILTYSNGVTVEITNTDAEGRLILADALLHASRAGARCILDAATLTGAAKNALGRDMCAVFTRDNRLSAPLAEAFRRSGEPWWQLPLLDCHRRFLKSRRADVCNSSHGEGAPGASTAASFLELFVGKDIPWTHIDLASAYLPDGSPYLAAGPSGALVETVALWLTGGSYI